MAIFLKKQVTLDKVIGYMYFLLCLGLCLYQVCTICQIYFSYKTTTFVEYENISKISLPAITICMDKIEVIKNEVLQKYKIQKVSDEFLDNFTIKEQFQ